MKKLIFSILTIILLTSCNNPVFNHISNEMQESTITGYSLYYGDFPEMQNLKDVTKYVDKVLEYKELHHLLKPYGPAKAMYFGHGDCDVYALLVMNIAYIQLGVKYDFASVYVDEDEPQRKIVNGGWVNHAVISLDGQLYSAYDGTPITNYEAGYIIKFDHVYSKSMK